MAYRIAPAEGAYVIVDAAGARVSKVSRSYDAAVTLLRQIEMRAGRRPRDCITCGRTFASSGPGHRMCGGCRHRSDDVADYSIAVSR